MKKYIAFGYIFVLLLASSAPSYALDFIKFGVSHDVDFWGTPNTEFSPFPSTVQYLAQRGKNQRISLDLTDQNVQDVFNGVYGSFDAIVVSEDIAVISPGSYALFNQFVSNGGCFILTGDHGDGEDDFLNNAFGYSVGIVTSTDNPNDTFDLQAASAGTQFDGGPAILVAGDRTTVFDNTPGRIIYQGTLGVTVFTDEFGSGVVNGIGWDYCCVDTPGTTTEQQILDWFEVINRAFEECSPTVPSRPIPTLSEWGLLSMAGILGMIGLFAALRRRKAAA